jgi:hypothetical protein
MWGFTKVTHFLHHQSRAAVFGRVLGFLMGLGLAWAAQGTKSMTSQTGKIKSPASRPTCPESRVGLSSRHPRSAWTTRRLKNKGCLIKKIASIVDHRGIKPILVTLVTPLKRCSMILSHSFIVVAYSMTTNHHVH